MASSLRAHAAAAMLAGACALAAAGAPGPRQVSFPTEDGGLVHADVYGDGKRGVVLAHGARFDKASWEKQARALEGARA